MPSNGSFYSKAETPKEKVVNSLDQLGNVSYRIDDKKTCLVKPLEDGT